MNKIIYDYNKDRSKNTIITENDSKFSLCLYSADRVIMTSENLQDVVDFANNKSNETMKNLYQNRGK